MRAAIAAAIRSKKVSDHVGFLTFMRNTGILHWDQQYQEALRDLDAQRTSAWTDEMEAAYQKIPSEYKNLSALYEPFAMPTDDNEDEFRAGMIGHDDRGAVDNDEDRQSAV